MNRTNMTYLHKIININHKLNVNINHTPLIKSLGSFFLNKMYYCDGNAEFTA